MSHRAIIEDAFGKILLQIIILMRLEVMLVKGAVLYAVRGHRLVEGVVEQASFVFLVRNNLPRGN